MWIVEPCNGGGIYILVPGEGGGLQKWPLTIKDLANDLTPYIDENMPFVYMTEKKKRYTRSHATDGSALRYFSSRRGQCNNWSKELSESERTHV